MAKLTIEAETAIHSEVRRILLEKEATFHQSALEEIRHHREFMFRISRWVVTGFFGLLIIFAVVLNFVFQAQLAKQVTEKFAEVKIND